MTSALIVSQVLLWIAVLALAATVFALLRQVGVLHERVAPAGALVGREAPRVGEAAPPLAVQDWSGRELTIGGPEPEGRDTLLVFVSSTCPVCKELLPTLQRVAAAEGPTLRLVLASDGPRGEHEEMVRRHGLERGHFVLSRELGLAYQVGRLPYAVLVGADGIVRARGLVNTREHLESLFEARTRGVASMQDWLAARGRA